MGRRRHPLPGPLPSRERESCRKPSPLMGEGWVGVMPTLAQRSAVRMGRGRHPLLTSPIKGEGHESGKPSPLMGEGWVRVMPTLALAAGT